MVSQADDVFDGLVEESIRELLKAFTDFTLDLSISGCFTGLDDVGSWAP